MSPNTQKSFKLKSDLIQLIQSGKIKNAEKIYLRHKNDDIPDVDVWNIFAGINSQKKNYNEILHCCEKILSLNPDNFKAMYNAGVASQHLSDYASAITHYENCIRINPGYTNAYNNCALCYELSNHTNKAITYYQRVIESSDSLDTRLRIGSLLAKNGDTGHALDHYNIALSKDPNNEFSLFHIAKLHYETMNYSQSETYYKKVISINPNNTTALNNLGRLYEETGDTSKAIEYFKLAISKNSDIALIHRNLGKALLKIKDLAEAELAFKKSLEIEPHPEAYFNLGKIFSEKNELNFAKENFEIALSAEMQPDIEKPEEFRLAIKYFLSSVCDPEYFNEDKKYFVSNLFDGYAEKFDDHLVNKLEYKTPELIKRILESTIDNKSRVNTIADLGCGTGLCASFLKPYTSNLIGIDISQKMVDKASELKLYDQLIVGEISEETNRLDSKLDIVIAADVFVYVGGLKDVFTACSSKFSTDGIFIFSTEVVIDDTKEYKLYDSGRYKHSIEYLDRISAETGFEVIRHESCTLRKERDTPVMGTISLLRKL